MIQKQNPNPLEKEAIVLIHWKQINNIFKNFLLAWFPVNNIYIYALKWRRKRWGIYDSDGEIDWYMYAYVYMQTFRCDISDNIN